MEENKNEIVPVKNKPSILRNIKKNKKVKTGNLFFSDIFNCLPDIFSPF